MARTITLKEPQGTYSTLVEQVQSTGEPLIVEQEGKPTVVVIPFAQYQQLLAQREREQNSVWQTEQEALLRKEVAAFEQMKPALLKTYLGKWVAILDGQLVDSDDDRRALSKRTGAKFSGRVVLIEQVLLQPRIYDVDSPEQISG